MTEYNKIKVLTTALNKIALEKRFDLRGHSPKPMSMAGGPRHCVWCTSEVRDEGHDRWCPTHIAMVALDKVKAA